MMMYMSHINILIATTEAACTLALLQQVNIGSRLMNSMLSRSVRCLDAAR